MAEKLVIQIDGDVKKYQDALKNAQDETKNLESQLTSIAKGSAIAFAGLGAAIIGAVNEASKIETMTTKFEVLTGSVSEANRLVRDLQKFSASTPFQLEGIGKATSQLLGFGFGTDEVKKKLQEIGDVAAASGRPMEEISLIYGQVGAAGKLTGERLLQFQERAIPIGPALAKTMGVAETSIKKLVSEGRVDFETFEKAFASMSEKGGKAFGGMEKLSLTLAGKISTLKDNFSLLAADIGKQMLPMFKAMADAATNGLQWLKSNPEIAKTAATLLTVGAAIAGVVGSFATLAIIALKLKAVFAAVGVVMGTISAPMIAIGLAVAGLVVVVADLAVNWEKRFKQMSAVFNAFAKNITNVGRGIGTFLAGVFTFDIDKIKDGYAQVKDAMVQGVKDIQSDPAFADDGDGNAITKAMSPDPEKIAEKHEQAAEVSLEKREELLGIQDEQAAEDLERQILVDELQNNQELQKINNQIKNETDKTEKLKLIQDRKALVDKTRDDLRLKQKFLTDKEKVKMDHATNKQLTDAAFSLASTLVSVSGASAKEQFIIQKTLGIAQVLINGYMASMLAQATIPPPAGQIIGASALTQGYISAGLIAATSALQFTGMAHGGLVTGGIPGIDSVPIMAQSGELMTPKSNFNEVIGSVRAGREAEKVGGGSGGELNLIVSYDSEEASQIVTVRQNEDSALGISQDSFKEAV